MLRTPRPLRPLRVDSSVTPNPHNERPLRVVLEGFASEIEASPGSLLWDAIREAGLGIDSDCGGRGTCGECRVRFLAGAPPATPEDRALLGVKEVEEGWRLACQALLESDCRIVIPQASPVGKMRILTTAGPDVLVEGAAAASGRVGYGGAIDIGTTTVVCYLMDLEGARQLGVAAFTNPQQRFGVDVVSRIVHAHRGPRQLAELRERLVMDIERHLVDLCSQHDVPLRSLVGITAVGNLTMMHLFRGVDPWPLGVAPYHPVFTEAPPIPAEAVGFRRLAHAEVTLLPGVGGHLGSDAVAGLMALGLPRKEGLSLFIDLGTNGEIVLLSEREAVGASCAAGPAFEGVHIASGMAAVRGAVERIDEENGRLRLDTIGGGQPLGLCGSGLADAVALLLRRGFLSSAGRLSDPAQPPPDAPSDLRSRLREEGRERRFVLYEDGARRPVVLTQRDVRQVQLAKAPIRAGVEILAEELGADAEDIDGVFIAGAFGSSMRAESLLGLGMLPEKLRGRIHSAGNVAGMGAKLAVAFEERLDAARRLAHRIRHVELMLRDDFQSRFAQHIPFPEPEAGR